MAAPSTEPDVIVYTDGACSGNPGPGGWAAILEHPATGKARRLSGYSPRTTNNRMELMAAIEGLSAVDDSARRRVRLVSDSEYVLRGLTEWIRGWLANDWRRGKKANSPPVKNADLWKTLHALTQKHEMTFEHVRGHSGHPENEECDRLAVAAIRNRAGVAEESETAETPTRVGRSEGPSDRFRRSFSGAPWESEVGYCRAIRAGDHVYVTGTASLDDSGHVFAPGDAYAQTRRCLEIIRDALHALDADVADIVRTRMWVTDITRWEEYGRAHREVFADHPPATSMVEVASLIDPAMLIEVEVEAVCLERG